MEVGQDPRGIVLVGKNGAGKTNVLEAVSFLSVGKGLRRAKFKDILCRTAEPPVRLSSNVAAFPEFWSVNARVKSGPVTLEIGTGANGSDSTGSKRKIQVNGLPLSSQEDLSRHVSAVWLTPAMDRLFSGEPSFRRRFFDRLVQSLFPAHMHVSGLYMQALKEWNRVLKGRFYDSAWLSALEEKIADYGLKMTGFRTRTMTSLQEQLVKDRLPLDDVFPVPALSFKTSLERNVQANGTETAFPALLEKLKASRKTCQEGGVFEGPHVMDFDAFHPAKGAAFGCSTGEQKALLISILLAQLQTLSAKDGRMPLILLDEVGAHLDSPRRAALFEFLSKIKGQVWMTATDASFFKEGGKDTFRFFEVVSNGLSEKAA